MRASTITTGFSSRRRFRMWPGSVRAKLFREGGLSIERFAELQLDRNFAPLSLAQMKALEPLAFERAGLR